MTKYITDKTQIPEAEFKLIERAKRYHQQDISASFALNTTGHRVRDCLRKRSAGSKILLLYSKEAGHGFYKGLQTCGSVWDCPVCSAKISVRRTDEVRQAADRWAELGGNLFMLTATVSHDLGDSLKEVSKVLTDALRFVKSGAPWQRIEAKYLLEGSITATEPKFNLNHGWHYHKHLMFFTRLPVGSNLDGLRKWVWKRYESYLNRHGFHSFEGIGIDITEVQASKDFKSDYITKWSLAMELTGSYAKYGAGISSFDLLDLPELSERWIEYSRAMFGKRQLTWSNGLRDLLLLGQDKTDEELAAEEKYQDAEIVWEIPIATWKVILQEHLRAELINQLELFTPGDKRLLRWIDKHRLKVC
jgi:hypothetical protein